MIRSDNTFRKKGETITLDQEDVFAEIEREANKALSKSNLL